MVERQIKLTANEDVKEFVNQASKCDFDIDVFYNRVVIDAKSILGVLSMDLTKVLTVRCNGHDERFDEFLNKFAVAQEKGAVAGVAAAFCFCYTGHRKNFSENMVEAWKRKE